MTQLSNYFFYVSVHIGSYCECPEVSFLLCQLKQVSMAILNPWKSAASSNIEQISRIPVPLTPRLAFPAPFYASLILPCCLL